MTSPRDPDGSTRITPASTGSAHRATSTGADVTGRMSGTTSTPPAPAHAKTSAAATFALVFGVTALFSALTGLLAPVAVVLGIIGIVLGVVGLKMSKRPGVTGHGVAVGALVTAVLGLVLGGVVLAGAAALVNNDTQLDRISNKIDDLRDNVPTGDQVQDAVTPS